MSQLRLGLLGYGRIAELVHARVLRGLTNVSLVAVAEGDATRRTLAERVLGARSFASAQELIDARAVDAVVVCLPTPNHADAAVAAFDAGLHVYLEKPIATTMEDAERVVSAWRRAGTIGMVGLNFRFSPIYAALRTLVQGGGLGRTVSVRSVLTSSPRALPAWKSHRASGGGALLDLATHHLDLLPYIFDEQVIMVGASVRSVLTEHDTATVQATLASGVLYQGTFSLSAAESHRFDVAGTEATAEYDRLFDRELRLTPARDAHTRERRLARALRSLHPDRLLGRVQPEPSFSLALAAFARAAETGDAASVARCAPDQAARGLSVVLAAERSSTSGVVEHVDAESRLP
jgi:predicted dehydrogenase